MLSTPRTPAIWPMRAVDSPGLLNVTNARLAYLSGAMYCVHPSLCGVFNQPDGASNFTFAFGITTVVPPPEEEEDEELDERLQQPVINRPAPTSPQKASPAIP